MLVASLHESIRELRGAVELPQIVAYLIDNSEQQKLTLDIFSDLAQPLEEQQVELRLIQGHGNIGYGRGHNLVLKELESKYHLILNPDIRVQEECLSIGLAFLECNKDIALASPYAEYPDGSKQYLCKRYPSVQTFIVRGFLPNIAKRLFKKRLARFEMHDLAEDQPSSNIPLVSGCFMLFRTEAFRKVGGFDENYFLYFEDFDLSLRLGKIAEIAYVPAMRIQHDGGHAAKKGWAHLKMFASSGIRFFNTHGWRFFSQADRSE